MAKSIMLQFGGETSSFTFSKLDRAKLYGYKERQIIDAEGERCSSAYLTSDGRALIPSGGLAMLYVDDGFATVERATLKTVGEDGDELQLQASTLGIEQVLEGPVAPQRLLDYAIHTVYQLAPEQIGAKLNVELESGQIFTAPFSYRDDYQLQTLFLAKGEDGLFALIGSRTGFDFVRRDAVPSEIAAEEDDLSEDLDFSMM